MVGRGVAALGLLVICAGAVVGANLFGVRDSLLGSATPKPRAIAVSAFSPVGGGGARQRTVLRSQPWWQGLDRLRGSAGATTRGFTVGRSASQWRARWTCRSGRLAVRVVGRAAALIDAACPGSGTAFATQSGSTRLAVSAAGGWTLRIDQQVDVPLVEPALASMSAPGTSRVFTGDFYRVDQTGTGRLTIYRLRTGRYVMRLSGFYVTPNVDLEIRLSPLRSPHSTPQFLSIRSALVAPLPITAGSLNFSVPRGVDVRRYRSVVLWCPPVHSAYAAAELRSTR